MAGTVLNVATVLIGGVLGLVLGARLSARLRETVVHSLGLFTFALGVGMFLQTTNPLYALGGLLLGAVLGEWWRIEDGLQRIGASLEARFHRGVTGSDGSARFVEGFMTASLLFCVGPMTILGSVQAGLSGDIQLLAVKSVLDGFAAIALASTLGVGVLFSALTILVYQGGLTFLAGSAGGLLSNAMVAEMTAVGGILLMALAVSSLLELKKVRTGNLLPGLIVAPLLVWAVSLLAG
ncbi:MAG: DUF554 domain-containing protein [Anaerolineales bacterium]|nr:DUF554 domain-containing protein [Anaerolineales bacterium]